LPGDLGVCLFQVCEYLVCARRYAMFSSIPLSDDVLREAIEYQGSSLLVIFDQLLCSCQHVRNPLLARQGSETLPISYLSETECH
jgi:hypothetical protein